MMKLLKLIFCALIFCVCSFYYARAQENRPIPFFTSKPNPEIVNYFNAAIGQKARLYNGAHYDFDSPTIEGNAFYGSSLTFAIGTVNYDGYRFEQVPLLYDIFRDILITTPDDHFTAFTLFNSKVSDFYINDHHFVKIDTSSIKDAPRPGFYDLVIDGEIKVLVKRSKTIQDKLGNIVRKYFSQASSFHILKDDRYYKISGKSSLMSLFKDQKALLNKKSKQEDLNFNKDPEKAIILLVNYYSTLKN